MPHHGNLCAVEHDDVATVAAPAEKQMHAAVSCYLAICNEGTHKTIQRSHFILQQGHTQTTVQTYRGSPEKKSICSWFSGCHDRSNSVTITLLSDFAHVTKKLFDMSFLTNKNLLNIWSGNASPF